MYVDVSYYELPAPQQPEQDVIYELNLVENPREPLVVLEDISHLLDVSTASEEEDSVIIIDYVPEDPKVIDIAESDTDEDEVLCIGGPYQEGDTTYLDIGLNDDFQEDPDFDESVTHVPSALVHELPLLLPVACSTPKPPDLTPCDAVNLNDAFLEESSEVFGTGDAEITIMFVAPCVAAQISEDFTPAASSTPVPMEL
ncbi:unnamed protein product [Rotaria magnacalcarata]|uniref:Uncharacterized protein n=1 Tax=Rotaria magnacalcarata TaxID=392030 RepID=A0A820HL81_9BILA|nr:unnamed protein product [Rotaria magnacalcarata]CAF4297880.1 unnamed protein product [Rotaria magnacalcarata]